ncbi:MAG: Energy-coupling factor transporter ATP-binding protein EcfA3 [Syntrophomonadaceae bacterium]|nr:Energy-coupling factor transporter ATP-binding protein EcfA3 [Bacillota bacterium]
MRQEILTADKITFTYLDGTTALHELSVKIPQGRRAAFVGNNGAGKTTLLLHFNGINRPDDGEVRYKERKLDYSSKGIKELRKNIGYVFQDTDSQLFAGSVYQDISFGPVNLGLPPAEIKVKLERVMRETGLLALKDKPPHALSHGQKKVVAIAGVLVMEPEVLILDEPTAGLDQVSASRVMDLLNSLNNTGTTIIFSSHNMDEVYAWADIVFVLKDGTIIAEGRPADVFRRRSVLQAASLRKPLVLELYDNLVSRGCLPAQAEAPATGEALLLLLGAHDVRPETREGKSHVAGV